MSLVCRSQSKPAEVELLTMAEEYENDCPEQCIEWSPTRHEEDYEQDTEIVFQSQQEALFDNSAELFALYAEVDAQRKQICAQKSTEQILRLQLEHERQKSAVVRLNYSDLTKQHESLLRRFLLLQQNKRDDNIHFWSYDSSDGQSGPRRYNTRQCATPPPQSETEKKPAATPDFKKRRLF